MIRIISGLMVPLFLVACSSGYKPYQKAYNKNIAFSIQNTKSTFFNRVKIRTNLYTINSKCERVYQGSLTLGRHAKKIGLPVKKIAFIELEFRTNQKIRNEKSVLTSGGYLFVKKGSFYNVKASYGKSIYHVLLTETRNRRKRKIDLKRNHRCR